MTDKATDALVEAIEAAQGLPVPTSREFAARVEQQLAARGYALISQPPALCVCTGSGWPHVPSSARCTPPVDRRREARAADPHAHACVSCSPDGVLPGPGCINYRQTGMDQTPCATPGHFRSCPHGCCGGPRKPGTAPNPSAASDA